jgi:hypothetical protein
VQLTVKLDKLDPSPAMQRLRGVPSTPIANWLLVNPFFLNTSLLSGKPSTVSYRFPVSVISSVFVWLVPCDLSIETTFYAILSMTYYILASSNGPVIVVACEALFMIRFPLRSILSAARVI